MSGQAQRIDAWYSQAVLSGGDIEFRDSDG